MISNQLEHYPALALFTVFFGLTIFIIILIFMIIKQEKTASQEEFRRFAEALLSDEEKRESG
jgi:hypothetical protein